MINITYDNRLLRFVFSFTFKVLKIWKKWSNKSHTIHYHTLDAWAIVLIRYRKQHIAMKGQHTTADSIVSPVCTSPGDSGMGSPSSSGERTPADVDHMPAGAGAETEVASSLLAACSSSVPEAQSKIQCSFLYIMKMQHSTCYEWL
jgi:hypothetical protein